MSWLYKKDELGFSLVWIFIYILVMGLGGSISVDSGQGKLVKLGLVLLLSLIISLWIGKNNLREKYGLVKSKKPAKRLFYYLPLGILATSNLWFGIRVKEPIGELILHMLIMLLVAFLEEIIFRGFLFRAMGKIGLKRALIVSSLGFGLIHIVNLMNGSGVSAFSVLLQISYASATGFLFAILFLRTGSLYAGIVTHGMINILSIFSSGNQLASGHELEAAISIILVAVLYALYASGIEI